MKAIIKTLSFGLALITLFSLTFLVGAHALVSAPVEAKTVGNGDFVQSNLFVKMNDSPIPQTEMQKEFTEYETVEDTEDDSFPEKEHQRQLTFFTEEQAEKLKARKDGGEMFTLDYDEILFIINDSIQKYFKYDSIVLTNAIRYGLTSKSGRSENSQFVYCYHGDFSEYEYGDAIQRYDEMMLDIYDIITYRISMLDAAFIWDDSSAHPHFIKSFDDTAKDNYRAFLDDEQTKYIKKTKARFSGYYNPEDLAIQLKAPLLFANYDASGKWFFIVETDCLTETTVYPTVELIAMRPNINNTKHSNSRSFFENIAKDIYPEYNINEETKELTPDMYVATEEQIKGMSFHELIDTFGLPYDGSTPGVVTGCYYLTSGEMLVVYFDSEFNVYSYMLLD